MRNEYEVRAMKFIRQFSSYIKDCKTYLDFELAVMEFNFDKKRKVIFRHGMTRVVFITSDYVVKMDFGREHDINKFGGCESEWDIYRQAQEDGYDYLFAKPTLFYYAGKFFCIMPKVSGVGKYWANADWYLKEDEQDWIYDHVCDLHSENYGWKNGHVIIFDYACERPEQDVPRE